MSRRKAAINLEEATQMLLDTLDQTGYGSSLDSDNELANGSETIDTLAIPIQQLKEPEVDNLDVTSLLDCESMFLYSLYVFHKMHCSHVNMTRKTSSDFQKFASFIG